MKRAYVRPTMVGERFVANEYVAACGDTEYGKYKFTCDAAYQEMYIENLMGSLDSRKVMVYLDMEEMNG